MLRYFLAVASEGNISKASKLLHITQPTLSRNIAQLEKEFCVKLFKRNNHGISLTREGKMMRRRAQEMVALYELTEEEMNERENTVEGLVTIGWSENDAVSVLADVIRAFREIYPNVRYKFFSANADQIIDRIDHGMLDMGLMVTPVDVSEYDFIRLGVMERWVAMMRADDPLVANRVVTPHLLADRFLILPERSGLKGEIDNWLGEYYDEKKVICECNISTNNPVFVEKGFGITLCTEGACKFIDSAKFVLRSLSPKLLSSTVLVWKPTKSFPPATTKFIEFAKEKLREREEGHENAN
ncbi:LysR family transcriptional regulator [Synergistes jonesii]|uniref:LysR family transcriptional regulator n=1 Tax=Synergistes jonesii TaxID=2754 RepID=UPI002A759500|nr:LysR family transcriptional regulator [Synergistes jonesii]